MNRWKEIELRDVCSDISYGYTASANETPIGPKFLRITDVAKGRINWESVPYCIINDKDSIKYKLEVGDIVIARTGATTGYNAIIKNDVDAVFASYLIRFKVDKKIAAPFFVGYVLQSNRFQDYVDAIAGGSAQPGANAQQFADFEFPLPPLHEQIQIASILSSLDDKIDLLHRQNKTLEQMAETLFRKWLIEKEEKTWEEIDLEYVTKRITDGSHHSPPTTEIGLPMASVKDMHNWGIDINTCRKIKEKDFMELVRNDCRPLKNDVIIAKDGSYLKHVFVCPKDLDVVILSSIAILRPNGKYNPLLLTTFLKMESTIRQLENIVTGGVIPRIVLKDFKKFKIKLPPIEIQNKALKYIEPLYLKCWNNSNQIHKLDQLRDTILPKLMSGEVKVKI